MTNDTDRTARTLALPDGRRIGVAVYGDPCGEPVLYCHGLPSSRLEAERIDGAGRELGARVVSLDRPGYGLSDPHPRLTLLDWPGDALAALDALGIARCRVVGVSGGGPYALAFARMAPARCIAVALVCALGPVPGGTAVRSMNLVSRAGFRLARAAPRLMRVVYGGLIGRFLRRYPAAVFSLLDATGCPADRAALTDPGLRASLVATVREAFRDGSRGAVDDLRVCSRPWEYGLPELTVPVQLWHGDADRTVPVAFAHAYAHALPRCETRIVPGEGHFSLPERYARPILARLLEAGQR